MEIQPETFMIAPANTTKPDEQKPSHDDLLAKIKEALKTVYDPEIPVDIYELGLIYDVKISANNEVAIVMTLTTPACPVAEEMPAHVQTVVSEILGVAAAKVELVWEPPWDPSKMSEDARIALGIF